MEAGRDKGRGSMEVEAAQQQQTATAEQQNSSRHPLQKMGGGNQPHTRKKKLKLNPHVAAGSCAEAMRGMRGTNPSRTPVGLEKELANAGCGGCGENSVAWRANGIRLG